jgi:predicted dienelactone hydrolase
MTSTRLSRGCAPLRSPARLVTVVACAVAAATPVVRSAGYDPRARAVTVPPAIDLVVRDVDRDRGIPIKVYRPHETRRAPVVLFSHGLGGSNAMGAFMGEHWAARGYVAVFLQHPGSDTATWRDAAPGRRMAALEGAATVSNFVARVKDVGAVLDDLARLDADARGPLGGRLDLAHVGMSGHSFGALTTQAVSGQAVSGRTPYTDRRIRAAIALSPSVPRRGRPEDAFAQVAIPWMLMTGTKDDGRIAGLDVASRLAVFPALPPGSKYEVVLFGAEHSAFTDRELPGDREPRNPNHHRAMLALSTAFWDAYLRADAAARAWLDGAGPSTVLGPKDRWQRK